MKRTFWLIEPMLNDVILICVGSRKQAAHWISKVMNAKIYEGDIPNGYAATLWMEDDRNRMRGIVIWLSGWEGRPGDVGQLAHEADHSAESMLQGVNMSTKPSDEIHAYLVGWIVREGLKALDGLIVPAR